MKGNVRASRARTIAPIAGIDSRLRKDRRSPCAIAPIAGIDIRL